MKTEIRPEVGEEYLLAYSEDPKKQESVTGVYIGRNPVKFGEGWGLLYATSPEGHIFIRRNSSGEAEIFHTGTLDKKLPLLWYSDGCDGPEWPAGFGVTKFNDDYLPAKVKKYLEERINRFEQARAA